MLNVYNTNIVMSYYYLLFVFQSNNLIDCYQPTIPLEGLFKNSKYFHFWHQNNLIPGISSKYYLAYLVQNLNFDNIHFPDLGWGYYWSCTDVHYIALQYSTQYTEVHRTLDTRQFSMVVGGRAAQQSIMLYNKVNIIALIKTI